MNDDSRKLFDDEFNTLDHYDPSIIDIISDYVLIDCSTFIQIFEDLCVGINAIEGILLVIPDEAFLPSQFKHFEFKYNEEKYIDDVLLCYDYTSIDHEEYFTDFYYRFIDIFDENSFELMFNVSNDNIKCGVYIKIILSTSMKELNEKELNKNVGKPSMEIQLFRYVGNRLNRYFKIHNGLYKSYERARCTCGANLPTRLYSKHLSCGKHLMSLMKQA